MEADMVYSAKLRIYKPRSMSQRGPVEVSVYKVSKINGDGVEGGLQRNGDQGCGGT